MIPKYGDFYDSAVMRQLAKQAIDKGIIPDAAVSIEPLPVVASGDLTVDLAILTNQLRDKGYVKQAQQLEESWVNFKQAERIVFNEILQEGHPDGDAVIGEASGQLGEVETLPSQHEKIVEVVEKKPTGKQAELIEQTLLAVAQTLNIPANNVPSANIPIVAPSEEELDKDFSKSRRDEKIKKINTLNGIVEQAKTQLVPFFDNLKDTLPIEKVNFSGEELMTGRDDYLAVYAKYAQVPGLLKQFKNYYAKHQAIYQGKFNQGEGGVDAIFSILISLANLLVSNKDNTQLKNYVSLISPNLFDEFKQQSTLGKLFAPGSIARSVGDVITPASAE